MLLFKQFSLRRLITAAACVALGLLLPVIFHSVQGFGRIFLPMHLPILLCGMLCGPMLGLCAGVITPLLSSLLTGMPPIFPTGLSMCLELAAYAVIAALLVKKNVHVALVGAMLGGRVVSALAQLVLLGLSGQAFALQGFLTAAFVTALPGIAIQLALVPLLVAAVRKAGLAEE